MVKNGKRKRQVTTRHEQMIALARQPMLCSACGVVFFLDEELGLVAGS